MQRSISTNNGSDDLSKRSRKNSSVKRKRDEIENYNFKDPFREAQSGFNSDESLPASPNNEYDLDHLDLGAPRDTPKAVDVEELSNLLASVCIPDNLDDLVSEHVTEEPLPILSLNDLESNGVGSITNDFNLDEYSSFPTEDVEDNVLDLNPCTPVNVTHRMTGKESTPVLSKEEFSSEASIQKPKDSFTAMIAKAILSTKNCCAMLNDIYTYILQKYPYYRTAKDSWKNSVHHTLSTNSFFIKSGRAPSGKGFQWGIHEACIGMFSVGNFDRGLARKQMKLWNSVQVKTINLQSYGDNLEDLNFSL